MNSNNKLDHLRAELEADLSNEQAWISYIEALVLSNEPDLAEQVLMLGLEKGLSRESVYQLEQHLGSACCRRLVSESRTLNSLVNLLTEGQLDSAETVAQILVDFYPNNAFVWKVLGTLRARQGDNDRALLLFEQALVLAPDDSELLCNMGRVMQLQGYNEAAIACHQHAITLKPEDATIHNSLGHVYQGCRELQKAVECFRLAVNIDPDYSDAYNNLAISLQDIGMEEEALDTYRYALKRDPNHIDLNINLATVLIGRECYAEAEQLLNLAIKLAPNNAAAHYNLGLLHQNMMQLSQAITSYQAALELVPDYVDASFNLSTVLRDCGQFDTAMETYRRTIALQPESDERANSLLFCVNYHPDLTSKDIYGYYQEYEIQHGKPFYGEWKPHENERTPTRRLKIGYVSPAFHMHSCRYFLEPLLAHHDKTQVEVYAYAQLPYQDEFTARYQSYVDHWIPTRGMSDASLAERIRADGIDILIDVAGHTGYNRLPTFARKPAPVSLHWLDFGYTTGLTAIDYYLTDEATIPEGAERYFAEQPWRLPVPAYAYRPASGMGEVNALPAFSRGHITFGTLTRAVRLNHRVIRTWAEILKAVPDSRLIINSGNFKSHDMQERIADKFIAHGITRERLEIGATSPPWDVLRQIDISLDCFPHNSGTTLIESLYMGTPFVTLANRPSVGMLGASILHGVGHPEWIAESEEEYIEKAKALASDLPKLADIRQRLRAEMESSPLMDEIGFTRAVEQAYRQMWQRWCRF